MPQYRKKPVVIQAWTARDLIRAATDDWSSMPQPVAEAYEKGGWVFASHHISIPTLEGVMRADLVDLIIQGVKGEFYPCKPDIFTATYDAVD